MKKLWKKCYCDNKAFLLSPGVPDFEYRKVSRFGSVDTVPRLTDLKNSVGSHLPRRTDLINSVGSHLPRRTEFFEKVGEQSRDEPTLKISR